MKFPAPVIVFLLLVPNLGIAQDGVGPVRGRPAMGTAPSPPGARVPGNRQGIAPLSAETWTLSDLEQMALRSNPTLAQASARVRGARAEWLQVGLYPNPRVGYAGSEIGNEGRAGQQGGFVGQELVTANKLQLNRSVASEEVKQAELAWEAQQCRVLTDVRRGFFEVLVAQRTVEITEQLVQIAQNGLKTIEQLSRAQEVAKSDVLQARIEADSVEVALDKARNRHLAAWRGLTAVVGAPEMRPTPLAGDLHDGMVEWTWEEVCQRAVAENPVLAAARVGVSRALAALNRECAGRVPNLDLETGVQYDNATGNTFANVQVSVPIAIFNRNQGNIQKAQSEITVAQNEVRRVELELHQRLAAAFEQYASARCQVEKYHTRILPNAKESLDLVAAGYRQGEFNYLMLLTAQRTYFQASLTYLEALRDLRTATANLEGNLLSDSLQGKQ